jgi:ATP-dependent DNA helicase RecG
MIEDMDMEALDWFAERIGWHGSHTGLLEEYNLWNGKTLNRAALLLFARKPLRWHDHPEITLVRYFGTKRGLGKDYQATPPQRITRPLVRLIEEAYAALEAHIAVRVELRDLFFENRADYPEFAWQEAIVNAVGHREYAITGAGTEIWLFDDHIDIRSPGAPPQPVSIEELRQAAQTAERGLHLSRNPLIVRVLIDAGYMREQGEGIPRMFQVMEEADLAPPELA